VADPKIRYDIEADVKGSGDISQLADETRRLGETLEGSLQKETLDAAKALDELGRKQGAITAFTALRRTTQELAEGLDAATKKVDQLGQELPQAATATAAFSAAEERARAALKATQTDLDTQRAALKALQSEYTGAARKTDEYKAASDGLKASIKTLGADLATKNKEVTAAAQATSAAVKSEAALTKEYDATVAAAGRLSSQFGTQRTALDGARASMNALGVETAGLAKTQRAVDAEIVTLRDRIKSLAPAYAGASAAAKEAADKQAAAAKAAAEAAGKAAKDTKDLTGEAGLLGDAFKRLGPIVAASFTGREFLETITQAESLKRGLTAITGSTQGAAAEIEYLRATSNRLGLELQQTGQAYLSLTAATKGTAIEGEKTRALFEAISLAMGALGKSSAETERALTAVSQMASKGTVSMEELRGQLGEALPGALAAAANGAGITTAKLIEMVSSGEVLAKDLLPALTKGLNDLYAQGGPPDTVISNWNRFKNVVTQAAIEIGEGGASNGISAVLSRAAVGATRLSESVTLVGQDMGEFAGAVATGNFALFTQAERLAASEQRMDRVKQAAGLATDAQKKLADGSTASGDAVREAFRKSEIAAQNASGAVVDSALKQQAAFSELTEAAKKRLEQAKKGAEAADAEARTIEMIASAFGTETDRRTASTLAATLQRDAQAKLTDARRADLALSEQKLATLAKEIAAQEKFSPELDAQKQKLEQSIAVKREEVRASDAMAKSHGVSAEAARVAAEAYKDNSGRVGELKAALDAATLAVEQLQAKQKAGKATAEEVSAAVVKQAAAQKLYNDSLADSVVKAEAAEKALARRLTRAQQESDLNLVAAQTTLELATARGDDATAAGAQVQVTNLEIEAKRQAAQGARDEAAAMRETAAAREKEALASGTLTTAKKEEIAAIRASADGKDIDAQKSDLLASKTAALAAATQSSAQSFVDALDKKVSAQERLNAVMERAEALERKRQGVDKEGFATDKNGARISAGGDLTSLTGIAAFLKNAGVSDDATARRIAAEFADSQGNVTYAGNRGVTKYGGDTISAALLRAAERITFGVGTTGTPAAGSTIPQATDSRTVNLTLNLNGQSYGTIKTDPAGSTAIQNLLSQIQTAKASAA
jgi:tape measure domain-containing protein